MLIYVLNNEVTILEGFGTEMSIHIQSQRKHMQVSIPSVHYGLIFKLANSPTF